MHEHHKLALTPQDLLKLFKVSVIHAPQIVPGLALQVLGRVREQELFLPLTWDCWNGTTLRIPDSGKRSGGIVEAHISLMTWFDVLAPGSPDEPIMAMSRAQYRKAFLEVRELAGIAAWGKDFFLKAGIALLIWSSAQVIAQRQQMIGNAPDSSTTASHYNGAPHSSWEAIASSLTPQALNFKS